MLDNDAIPFHLEARVPGALGGAVTFRSQNALAKRLSASACAVLCCAAALAIVPAPAGAAPDVKKCRSFVVFRGTSSDGSRFHYPATDVRRSARLRCGKVRRLLKGAYGQGPLRPINKVYPRDENGNTFGRPTYWFRGGWRCSNGAGGAGCWNAKRRRFNVIDIEGFDHGMAITANVGYADG